MEELENISKWLNKQLEKYFEKKDLDRAFVELKISARIYDESFLSFREEELFNEFGKDNKLAWHYCGFCNKETKYKDKEKGIYLCIDCFDKLTDKNK